MLEPSPLFDLLFLLPEDALRRAANYYRNVADSLDYEAKRRAPLREDARRVKKRVETVNGALMAAARAIMRGESRPTALWNASVEYQVPSDQFSPLLPVAMRRLRAERDELTRDLAREGRGDAAIATELKSRGYTASIATVQRALRKRRGEAVAAKAG